MLLMKAEAINQLLFIDLVWILIKKKTVRNEKREFWTMTVYLILRLLHF